MATKKKIRKANGNSKLDSDSIVPKERRQELVDGLLAGWTYAKAKEWLWVECGVKIALSAFTPFFARHVEPVLQEQKQFAALTAKTIEKLATDSATFDAATIAEFKEYAFQLIRNPEGDPEEKRKWFEALIKAQAGSRDERKLTMLEKKAAKADEAEKVANDEDLTEAEKATRMKQIFRMGS